MPRAYWIWACARLFSLRFQISNVSLIFCLQEMIFSLVLWSSWFDISKARVLYLSRTGGTVTADSTPAVSVDSL